jgi:hypothetical protein
MGTQGPCPIEYWKEQNMKKAQTKLQTEETPQSVHAKLKAEWLALFSTPYTFCATGEVEKTEEPKNEKASK